MTSVLSNGMRNYDWARHHAAFHPTRQALLDLQTGRRLTYAQLDDRADRLARHLQDLGVGKGDRVAILAYNGTEFFELQFACGRIGAIAVLLNWRLTVHELDYIVRDSMPRVIIHDIGFTSVAVELQRICGADDLLVIGDTTAANGYEAALAGAEEPPECAEVALDDPAVLIYTSGTTGHPKGAVQTHGAIFWNCINVSFMGEVTASAAQLVSLPLFHTGGLNAFANPILHAGGRVVLQRAFDPDEALAVMGDPEHAITHFVGVPAMYQAMAQSPAFQDTDLRSLKVAIIAGAPVPLATMQTYMAAGVAILQAYGMTETVMCVTMLDPADATRKLGSAGKPLMRTEVRIVGADGVDVRPGEVGELWTRGPNVIPEYWNAPEATAESFEDGWLKTGDLARRDDEGFVYIVDRSKDMYISGGENVYPAEVENVISQLPQVGEVAVVGVPHARWGETGTAVIVPKPGSSIDQATVLNHCAERLARYKVPSSVLFVDDLPRNATGKVLKRELRTLLADAATPAND